MTPFDPGPLTREQSDRLNAMARKLENAGRISATPPLTISHAGGNPVISLAESYQPILAEITGNSTSSGSATVYTAKRKTRDTTNAIVDFLPKTPIENVINVNAGSSIDDVLANGTLVNLQAIEDWPLPGQWWWAYPLAGSNGTHIVKLTGSGPGADGGIAWTGLIQEEVGGVVIDGDVIGEGCGGSGSGASPYVMYATVFSSGKPGLPQIGDRVIAVPDPLRPCIWLFVPKQDATNPSPCGGCGWITDIPDDACLRFRVAGGAGRCLCYPDVTSDNEVSAVWNGVLNGWVGTKMLPTCCGYGMGLFQINIAAADPLDTMIFWLKGVHVSCQGGSGSGSGGGGTFDLALKFECCGIDELGRKYVSFYGKGPDACDGAALDCDNVFRILVYCDECPDANCRCAPCGATVNPLSWFALLAGFSDDHNNGYWVWNQSDLEDDCQWKARVVIDDIEVFSTFEYIAGGTPKWRLTHSSGSVYEKNVSSNECGGDITLTKISGDGPGTITLKPLLPINESSLPTCCTGIDLEQFPDAFTVTFAVTPACPLLTGSYPVTRDSPPAGPYSWSWDNPSPGPGAINSVIVKCEFGSIDVTAVGSCANGDPIGGSFGGLPTSVSYSPLGIVLSIGATTGPAMPDASCCTNSSSPGTVTLH